MTKRITIPDEVAADVWALYRAEHGRDPSPSEVGADLAKTLKRFKAAAANADRSRNKRVEEFGRKHRETYERKRAELAAALGQEHHLAPIRRPAGTLEQAMAGESVRVPDSPVALIENERIVTRSALFSAGPYVGPLQVQDVRDVYGKSTGVDGIPFSGSIPYTERTLSMQPFLGRGLSFDMGNLDAAFRTNSIIRDAVNSRVGIFSSATMEVDYPSQLTDLAAKQLGVNRDRLEQIADAVNIELHLGRNALPSIIKEQVRNTTVAGFCLHEFTIDPHASLGRRIGPIEIRTPNSVMRWIIDGRSGKLIGVQQTNPGGYGNASPFIDIRRCLHAAIDADGNNFEGVSLIRSANQWDKLAYEVTSASILNWQRFGAGMPTIRLGPNASSASGDNGLFDALQKWVNDPQAVLQLPPGATVEMLQMQLDTGLAEIIAMCTQQMRAALGDSVSGLAENGVGSYALGDIKSQIMIKRLQSDARVIEDSFAPLIKAYVDLVFGPQLIYPRLRLSGFAARSPVEVLQVQTQFADLVARNVHTDQELEQIAQDAGVRWNGRGSEADVTDAQADGQGATAAPVADAPKEPLQVGSLQVAAELIRSLRPADATVTPLAPDVAVELLIAAGIPAESAQRMVAAQMAAAAPEALTTDPAPADGAAPAPAPVTPEEPAQPEGAIPPGAAQQAAADGRRARSAATEKWTASMADLALTKRIAAGEPLSRLELRTLESYFRGLDDPTTLPGWADKGPAWQEFHAFGGQAMADWLGVVLAETDEEPITRSAPAKYSHIDFTPPEGVRAAAKRALEVRDEKPESQRGMTPVGIARARDLSNGRAVSPDTARRMLAFFERHEGNKSGETWDEQGKGWQAWHGWGGDAGFAWARKLVKQMDAADEEPESRSVVECGCSVCITTRAGKRNEITVSGRGGGAYVTHRALNGNEGSVAWADIQASKDRTAQRITRAVEREQKAMRAEFMAAAAAAIESGDTVAASTVALDYTTRFRQAIEAPLLTEARWAARDMRAEMRDAMGGKFVADTDPVMRDSIARAKASAILLAEQVQSRTLEELRMAAMQLASGAAPSAVADAGVGFSRTGAGLVLQAVSTTVNAARAETAATSGPRIARAVYSAVMDRYTCDVCAAADGTVVEYGSDEYRRLSPPNPACKSVANSGTNMCQCVWVYEYEDQPGRSASAPVVTTRSATGPQRVTLLVGPPGSGKSTYAQTLDGVVVDRDDYVLADGAYQRDGIAASIGALSDAIEAGERHVVYVACLLTESSRAALTDTITGLHPGVQVDVIGYTAPREELERVNAARAETDRGAIPPDQLTHMLDAWEPPLATIERQGA